MSKFKRTKEIKPDKDQGVFGLRKGDYYDKFTRTLLVPIMLIEVDGVDKWSARDGVVELGEFPFWIDGSDLPDFDAWLQEFYKEGGARE